MATQTLYKSGAFGPGSKLWITPELEQSNWTRLIDWYLNFQISKAKFHNSQEASPQLKKIAYDNDVELKPIGNLDFGG